MKNKLNIKGQIAFVKACTVFFMVMPRINDMKWFIAQLMHSNI